MVHLFTIQYGGIPRAVLARRINGQYVIESIDGFDASHFSASLINLALRRVGR